LGELAARFKQFQMGSGAAYREVKGSKEQSRILSLALIAMSVIIGAMGALGVLNTLTLNVLERRREIGILRAMGSSDAHLVQIFFSEGLALGFGGWVLGILLGYPLGLIFVRLMQSVLFQIDYIFSPSMIAVSFIFALSIAALGSLAPALGAARLRVGEVLRYE
ncbi:MAG: ABC transporter permease, partial [Chloroflexi bacterium]|nr:ABC transporter permease [Chloroflexota bacterium]